MRIVIYFIAISLILITEKCLVLETIKLQEYSIEEITVLVKDSCVLVASQPTNFTLISILQNLTEIFSKEPNVKIGLLRENSFPANEKEQMLGKITAYYGKNRGLLMFYPKEILDRKCLLKPPKKKLKSEEYNGDKTTSAILEFLNSKCGKFRTLQGGLPPERRMRDFILQNVYSIGEKSLNKDKRNTGNGEAGPVNVGSICEKITMPTQEEFIHQYLFRSKPVIIKGAMDKWPAMHKWTNEYLTSTFGKNKVRVAFAPNAEYEGCEKASDFEDFQDFKFPDGVKEQLPFPDLVVVRPAFMNLKFAEFMSLLEKTHQTGQGENVSAYLEYSSIPSHLPELEKDVIEMPFVAGVLKRRHLNIWLSNGNTLGKLHFDPFDNFLCQISGRKQVLLYEPYDNTRLYEAHIQEAELGYNPNSMQFRRKKLMDSTSMVMSPINILKPDYKRFPKFKGVQAMNCTIDEGEVLFMPSFWWHEVQSYPNQEKPRNVAINYWYEPFLTKEYPCDSCKIDINPFYHHLLH
ncbi:lysine-specific demethylase 8-like [Actinia tenebrosa]|uniref:Lysine-specific demethylase 8-like n=1 Tax=Actinia tenebrosa TaxID=6105 RepID=A0A6P8J4D4_ACTTE|nr:lysine-specific demethylase 8-like [Actinia tenebrosa]